MLFWNDTVILKRMKPKTTKPLRLNYVLYDVLESAQVHSHWQYLNTVIGVYIRDNYNKAGTLVFRNKCFFIKHIYHIILLNILIKHTFHISAALLREWIQFIIFKRWVSDFFQFGLTKKWLQIYLTPEKQYLGLYFKWIEAKMSERILVCFSNVTWFE